MRQRSGFVEVSRNSVMATTRFAARFRPELRRDTRATRAFARGERPVTRFGMEVGNRIGDQIVRALTGELTVVRGAAGGRADGRRARTSRLTVDLGLDDRGAFVTGGARGIGRAIVERLLCRGRTRRVRRHRRDRGARAITAIGAGERVRFVRCDVSSEDAGADGDRRAVHHISAASTCS